MKKPKTRIRLPYRRMKFIASEKEIKPTTIWECPNGHWARVELLLADGLVKVAVCPICNQKMSLSTKELETIRTRMQIIENNTFCKSDGIREDIRLYAKNYKYYRGIIEQSGGAQNEG